MTLRATSSIFFVFVLVAGLMSCAGPNVTKVGGDNKLPEDLPKELQDKFEVKEFTEAPQPSPLPSSSPIPLTKKELAKQKAQKKAKEKKVKNKEASPTASPTPTSVETGEIVIPQSSFPNRRPAKDPIWVGEKHVFEITYFGMSAGDFTVEVMPHKVTNDRKVYHVKGVAVSSKVFSLFYRLNDTVESLFDYEGLFSHRFHILLDESKQTRDSLELNDTERKRTFYWNRWNHKTRGYSETKGFYPIEAFSQDSLSSLFYMRTLPLKDGDVYSFPVVSEGKSWEGVVTVVRREVMSTPKGKVKCIVLKPDTKFQGILQKRGDSFIWVTDDERRFLVRLEAKVRIGTVVAQLKELEDGTPP